MSTSSLRTSWRSRPVLFRRGLATEAAAAAPSPEGKPPPRPIVRTAVILNRSPILTRTPTSLERAYYAYQARVQRALHNPFPRELYFKPGSLLESKFNLEERRRDRKAFGPGFGADHPLAPGAGVTAQDLKKFGRDVDETPAPRVHASDESGDVKSLDRKGQRNLYLLVRQKTDEGFVWRFPETAVAGKELLHESVARGLRESCGEAMDTWIVTRKPIGLYEIHPPAPIQPGDPAAPPKHTSWPVKQGQGNLSQTVAWLTKKEIAKRVNPEYWDGVKDMLSDF
ncbi:50S ribosomal subunit L30 [Russula earlei]|uniref:50S ribosomal subunit L30 n=1 Tax=Russula earlei TaxID=71964 RepID=A0ACC0UEL2_9AGAM|nr:50S ribosomal subunit L30 [Russula earlei]